MPADSFVPDVIKTEKRIGTNDVRITFSSDQGDEVRVVLDQTRLLHLTAALHEKLERSPLTPISLDRLRPGKLFAVQGTSVQRLEDGSLKILLIAEFEDRVVEVPFSLDPAGVGELREQLGSV